MNLRIETQSIRTQVYKRMLQMILDGVWKPGSRVDVNQIVKDFGVSKTPVNEALQMLLHEELLFVKPRSGTFVRDLKPQEVLMTFDFRLALVIGSAEPIVRNITPAITSQLSQINAEMTETLNTDDPSLRPDLLSLDAKFHDTIIQVCGNPLIIDQYRRVYSLSGVSQTRSVFTDKEYKEELKGHERIIAALEAGKVDQFCVACQDHIKNAKKMLECLSE